MFIVSIGGGMFASYENKNDAIARAEQVQDETGAIVGIEQAYMSQDEARGIEVGDMLRLKLGGIVTVTSTLYDGVNVHVNTSRGDYEIIPGDRLMNVIRLV